MRGALDFVLAYSGLIGTMTIEGVYASIKSKAPSKVIENTNPL